ncbi:MAG: hypothetical protein PHE78_05345 [Candidatus Gastranaerophilales bacterium]|nr:hypothetical protein [Candidatus Gastranaerophilales bacterium]
MAIAGFNPDDFAKSLTEQAKEVVPADLPQEEKDFIANILYRFCKLAGDALINDTGVALNAQQASIITQFIGEWTFHKSIDLIRSGIPIDKRDPILQKIAFAVFEESRAVIVANTEQDEAIAKVEHAVGIAYQEALEEMKKQHQLDDDIAEKAKTESNIDRMAEQAREEAPPQQQQQSAHNPQQTAASAEDKNARKLLRLAAIALLLKKMSSKHAGEILQKLNEREAKAISSYMQIDGLEEAFDMNTIKNHMQEFLLTIPQEAQAFTEKQKRQKYTELTKSVPQEELDAILRPERSKVKDSIENVKKVKEMPSKVSNIVLEYLKEKTLK